MPNSYTEERASLVDFVIPTYSGWNALRKCLASLESFHEAVLVVDDAGSDNTVEQLASDYPAVRVIVRENNGGFSAAVNDGIRAEIGEFVVVLNNDVEVTPGFLDPILPLFEDESIFSVSPRIILPKMNGLDEGAKTSFWHHGQFFTDQRQGVNDLSPILYATGCAAVYRRSMLEELGGFDEAYSPFYWEDVDLGYRAWKRGWRSLYQPESTVYHQHSASISKIKASYTDRIKARNSLFFIWRNIEDKELIQKHRKWLPLVLGKKASNKDWAYIRGWADAWGRRNECESARQSDSVHRKLSDREIFEAVGINV